MRIRHSIGIGTVLLALVVLSCDDSTGPGVEPEIRNIPDNFEFQVTALSNYTGTLSYTWQNSGTAASVDQSTAVTGGTARIQLRDDDGTLVFDHDLALDGTFLTGTGSAGDWQVRVLFDEADGTINFRVQAVP